MTQTSPTPSPTPSPIDPSRELSQTFTRLWEGFLEGLPRLFVALVVLTVFVVVALIVRRLVRPRLAALRTESFGRVVSELAFWGIVAFGLMTALPIAFVNLSPTGVLGGASVLALAAGFALQDIATNVMSGLLLVIREPFRRGDEVEVNGLRGIVHGITIRETQLRTYDGHLILVPNKDVYTSAVDVRTHFGAVRSSFVTGVAYGTDLATARRVALDTLAATDGVLADPAPEVYVTEHGASAVALDLLYWTQPQEATVRRVEDRVAAGVHDAFGAAGIEIPFDIVTLDAGDSLVAALDRGGDRREGSGT